MLFFSDSAGLEKFRIPLFQSVVKSRPENKMFHRLPMERGAAPTVFMEAAETPQILLVWLAGPALNKHFTPVFAEGRRQADEIAEHSRLGAPIRKSRSLKESGVKHVPSVNISG
jgi:hypothetical protein